MESKSSLPDIIYQNVQVFNNSGSAGSPTAPGYSSPAIFSEDRTQVLLDNPNDRVGSLVKFQIPTTNVPILTFNADRPFIVSLEVGPSIFTQPVVYTSRTAGSTIQTVFTYDHMVQMVNTALAAARAAAFAAGATQLTEPPYMTYDATTRLFRLVAPKAQYYPEVAMTGVIGTSGCRLWMNDFLYHLFHGIDAFYNGIAENLTTGRVQNMLVYDRKSNSLDATHWYMQQMVPTLSLWNDARSIVITTTTMPIVSEWIASKSVTLGSAGSGVIGSSILTDFAIGAEEGPINASYQVYIPSVTGFLV